MRFVFGFAGAEGAFGSGGFSLKAIVVPAGRRNTSPGLASAALTLAGSSVTRAIPILKRSVVEPHAASADFCENAATTVS